MILDSLHRPTASELSRKRKIDRNPPPKGKRRSRGSCSSDPKSVTPQQRVRKYPEECFFVSNNKLFCLACREELSVKSSVITGHIKSSKHNAGKSRLTIKKKRDMEIAEALKLHDHMNNPKGETLPDNQRVYRVKVVHTFLSAGVPISKIPLFRELLEENGFRLTDRRRMTDIVPLILSQEKEKIKNEIAIKDLSVIFDGTTRLGEMFVIVIRFIDSDWGIQQRLIKVHILAKSLSGEEIAREVINSLSLEYGIASEQIIFSCYARLCLYQYGGNAYTESFISLCCRNWMFSHTLDRVGERFNVPTLHDFMTYWISLFAHSPKPNCYGPNEQA